MSATTQPVRAPIAPEAPAPRGRLRAVLKGFVIFLAIVVPLGLAGWAGLRAYRLLTAKSAASIPTTRVRRSDVTFTVTATGGLRGGRPEMIMGPMVAGGELRILSMPQAGELLKAGDVVVALDTTEQALRLREAQADLAEAEQQLAKAKAESEAQREENNYMLLKAKADVRQAELEVRRNRLLSKIAARQNELALESARDRLTQLEHDLPNRAASNQAAIAMQEAARAKATAAAAMARKNIDSMTVRATRDGYFSPTANTSGLMMIYPGMQIPSFQVGDAIRPGMVVGQIPDLKDWEVAASMSEVDRGHLAPGQPVEIRVVAVPFRTFKGKISSFGSTTGSPWDRRFECLMSLDNPSPELRPGMNAEIVITTDTLKNVLWVPGQAVFESDGRTHVYVPSGTGFAPRDVKLVRRGESQAVISGLGEGQTVALANPSQQPQKSAGPASGGAKNGAMKAIPK